MRRVPSIPTSAPEVLTSTVRQEKSVKDIIRKKEIKLSLFTADMITYIGNLKESTNY